MVAHNSTLKLVRSSGWRRAQCRSYGKFAAGIFLVAALIGSLVTPVSENAIDSGAAYVQPAPSGYMHSVYQNQAKDEQPEEHIQAF